MLRLALDAPENEQLDLLPAVPPPQPVAAHVAADIAFLARVLASRALRRFEASPRDRRAILLAYGASVLADNYERRDMTGREPVVEVLPHEAAAGPPGRYSLSVALAVAGYLDGDGDCQPLDLVSRAASRFKP
ncbi:MAG: hypothetical protein RLY93_20600 [Sumerlaeia bacterium]